MSGTVRFWMPVGFDSDQWSKDRCLFEREYELDFLPVEGMTWAMGDYEFTVKTVYFDDGVPTVAMENVICDFTWEKWGRKSHEGFHVFEPADTPDFLNLMEEKGWIRG